MTELYDNGLEGVWDSEGMSQEDVRAAAEGNLVPKGRWEGQLQPIDPESDVKVVTTESGDHPLEGQKVVRCHALLWTDAGEKHLFFDAFPSTVIATSKKGTTYVRRESEHAAYLYEGTKLIGRPFGAVLAHAANNRLIYEVGIRKAREDKETGEHYKAENTLNGIRPVVKEA